MDKATLYQLKQLQKRLKEQAGAIRKTTIKPALSDEQLFLKAMQGVVPISRAGQFDHPQVPASPWPKLQAPQLALPHEDISDFWPWDELGATEQLLFAKPGLRLDALRKLKRGQYDIEAELDLHGESTESARQKVIVFLDRCVQRQQRCVRIIHGKGLSSRDGQPVLKLKLKNWLVQRSEVLAFAQAKPAQGADGAVLVLLKSGRSK
ncbi:Smr/MutS family protein [Chitinibacter sp. GC72]|uniref:Smr/MutS family protein n=1 Tax=Chitinibacter sp. GC72 TaxID=1526917 RepID=UPI0012F741DD|nr:Smr/MutS family protein [Chitinibacter sp. GC72]